MNAPQGNPEDSPEVYLGDGVYASCSDWGQILMTVSNGVTITDRIYLDPVVLRRFEGYVEALRAMGRLSR